MVLDGTSSLLPVYPPTKLHITVYFHVPVRLNFLGTYRDGPPITSLPLPWYPSQHEAPGWWSATRHLSRSSPADFPSPPCAPRPPAVIPSCAASAARDVLHRQLCSGLHYPSCGHHNPYPRVRRHYRSRRHGSPTAIDMRAARVLPPVPPRCGLLHG